MAEPLKIVLLSRWQVCASSPGPLQANRGTRLVLFLKLGLFMDQKKRGKDVKKKKNQNVTAYLPSPSWLPVFFPPLFVSMSRLFFPLFGRFQGLSVNNTARGYQENSKDTNEKESE